MLENYLKNILSKYVRLADTRNTHFWLLWGKTRTTHWYNALHSLMASTIDSNCISFPRLDTHRHVWISLSFRRFCKKNWHVVCSCGDRIQHCLRTRGPSDLDYPSKSAPFKISRFGLEMAARRANPLETEGGPLASRWKLLWLSSSSSSSMQASKLGCDLAISFIRVTLIFWKKQSN